MNWDFFTANELTCNCGCGEELMKGPFMQKVIGIRRFAPFKFLVFSAYRCPTYNDTVSSTGIAGPHTTGRAIDITVGNSWQRNWLVAQAIKAGFNRIGVGRNFIHLDDLTISDGFPEDVMWHYYGKG